LPASRTLITNHYFSILEPRSHDHVGGVSFGVSPMSFAQLRFAVILAAGALLWVGIMPDDPTQAALISLCSAVVTSVGMAVFEL
jgi:hypothetical protein